MELFRIMILYKSMHALKFTELYNPQNSILPQLNLKNKIKKIKTILQGAESQMEWGR